MQSWGSLCSAGAGQEFTARQNSRGHLQDELCLVLQPFPDLGLPQHHSVVGSVSVPDPKRRISAARAACGGMTPVLDVIPALCQGVKHLWKPQTLREPRGVTPGVGAGTG